MVYLPPAEFEFPNPKKNANVVKMVVKYVKQKGVYRIVRLNESYRKFGGRVITNVQRQTTRSVVC